MNEIEKLRNALRACREAKDYFEYTIERADNAKADFEKKFAEASAYVQHIHKTYGTTDPNIIADLIR